MERVPQEDEAAKEAREIEQARRILASKDAGQHLKDAASAHIDAIQAKRRQRERSE
jgi:CHASE3 domain sensor protein